LAIEIDIPQRGILELQHAVFDINGTLAIDGVAIPGITDRLQALSEQLFIHLLTSDTYGHLADLEKSLGFAVHEVIRGEEKMRYVQNLGPINVIAFGNGVNDSSMLRLAAIGVAVLTPEGIATRALQGADIVAYSPTHAIDLVLKPKRLIATLRG
jgi:soluble P-type ATPase